MQKRITNICLIRISMVGLYYALRRSSFNSLQYIICSSGCLFLRRTYNFAVTFEKPNIQTSLSILIGLLSSCLRQKWHQTSDLMSFLGSNSGKVTLLTETATGCVNSGTCSLPSVASSVASSLIANTIVIIFQFIIIFWPTVTLHYRQVTELASTVVVCFTAIYI